MDRPNVAAIRHCVNRIHFLYTQPPSQTTQQSPKKKKKKRKRKRNSNKISTALPALPHTGMHHHLFIIIITYSSLNSNSPSTTSSASLHLSPFIQFNQWQIKWEISNHINSYQTFEKFQESQFQRPPWRSLPKNPTEFFEPRTRENGPQSRHWYDIYFSGIIYGFIPLVQVFQRHVQPIHRLLSIVIIVPLRMNSSTISLCLSHLSILHYRRAAIQLSPFSCIQIRFRFSVQLIQFHLYPSKR